MAFKYLAHQTGEQEPPDGAYQYPDGELGGIGASHADRPKMVTAAAASQIAEILKAAV